MKRCIFPGCTDAPLRRRICEAHLNQLNDFARPGMPLVEFSALIENLVLEFAAAGGRTALLRNKPTGTPASNGGLSFNLIGSGAKW